MNNNKDRIWVNQEQMLEIHSLYHLEPVLRIARSLIHNTLFSAGMELSSNGSDASNEFIHILDRYWIPFASDVLDHLFMFGICPYVLTTRKITKKINNGRVQVPLVPKFGMYKVEMKIDDEFRSTFHAHNLHKFPMGAETENKKIKFLTWSNYEPDYKGNLQAPLMSILYSFRMSRQMFDYALKVEHERANPTLITQTVQDKHKEDSMAVEMFADGDAFMEKSEASYLKNKRNLEDLHRQQQLASSLNSQHRTEHKIDPLTGRVMAKKRKRNLFEVRMLFF